MATSSCGTTIWRPYDAAAICYSQAMMSGVDRTRNQPAESFVGKRAQRLGQAAMHQGHILHVKYDKAGGLGVGPAS